MAYLKYTKNTLTLVLKIKPFPRGFLFKNIMSKGYTPNGCIGALGTMLPNISIMTNRKPKIITYKVCRDAKVGKW